MKICQAQVEHAKDILKILHPHIESGVLLPRDKDNIIAQIATFSIAIHGDMVVGCTAVKNYGKGLFEIRSLSVEKAFSNKGIGTALIKYVVEHLSQEKSCRCIFALTLKPNLFIKAGFKIVGKDVFPEKIWEDCSKCKKLHSCDEVAVSYFKA